ncbi:hypothetical protein QWJ46_12870 [Rhizobium sp. CBN3]|uniref:hypothetical protein n=1 Tax=Rhizobium sp. CBN3 TaxID=3058045 RepID=UPI0026736CA9|nr:hypothetical protein [Rhizobium sp. CBN3]MDO3433578.1 hypothetical protein [Rhizobium sp. CBN3]
MVTEQLLSLHAEAAEKGATRTPVRRLRKGMGGGADAGACLGSLIEHEYHRMMTSGADRCLSFRGESAAGDGNRKPAIAGLSPMGDRLDEGDGVGEA